MNGPLRPLVGLGLSLPNALDLLLRRGSNQHLASTPPHSCGVPRGASDVACADIWVPAQPTRWRRSRSYADRPRLIVGVHQGIHHQFMDRTEPTDGGATMRSTWGKNGRRSHASRGGVGGGRRPCDRAAASHAASSKRRSKATAIACREGIAPAATCSRKDTGERATGSATGKVKSSGGSMAEVTTPILRLQGRDRPVDGTLVMGVVNASPESFSDRGDRMTSAQRLEHCASLVEAGADIIDVGGQSAITNRSEIDVDQELERVVPIVAWLRSYHPDVLISVDTYKPQVVEAVLDAGAVIINDVSGLANPQVVDSCTRHQAALVVMHTAARPLVRLQRQDLYRDVSTEVRAFLRNRMDIAVARGLPRESVILDPGPDFTKTPHQTVAVLRRLAEIRVLGRPVLLALSRKDFLGAVTGRPPRGRDAATNAAVAYFASTPGNIVRVHDVAAARDVIATVEVLAGMREIDPSYLLPDAIRHEPWAVERHGLR